MALRRALHLTKASEYELAKRSTGLRHLQHMNTLNVTIVSGPSDTSSMIWVQFGPLPSDVTAEILTAYHKVCSCSQCLLIPGPERRRPEGGGDHRQES